MKHLFIFLLFFFITIQVRAASGGWTSNGGDYLKTQNNPWFLGDESVSVCVQSSPDYPLLQDQLVALTNESLNDWKEFLLKYRMDKQFIGTVFHKGQFKDQKVKRLALNFHFQANCTNPAQDELTLLFGKTNEDIEKAIEQRSRLSVGLSLRQDYNHESLRNPGYIWIKNFTSDKAKIKHILLHELGHVFGMKHNSVFVMDERVADNMDEIATLRLGPWGQIESPVWLYNFLSPSQDVHFTWNQQDNGSNSGYASNKKIPREFRSTLGLKEEGYHSLSFKFLRAPSGTNYFLFELTITVLGETEKKSLFFYLSPSHDLAEKDFLPGVYSKWFDAEGKELGYFEQLFELQPSPRSFIGVVAVKYQKCAATLSFNRGIILRIFSQEEGSWWEIK